MTNKTLKSKAELQNTLSPESFMSPKKAAQKDLLQVSIGITLKTDFILVFAVARNFLNLRLNLMLDVAGLASMKHLTIKILQN